MRRLQLVFLAIAISAVGCQSNSISPSATSNLYEPQALSPHIVQGGSGAKFIEALNIRCVDGLIAGPLDSIWFIDQCNDKVGRISMADQVTKFALRSPAGGLAVGGDNNLWVLTHRPFLEQTIVKVTPTGAMTPYSIPCKAGGVITQVGTGADGNIWFAVRGAHLVGRMKLDGTSTCFSTSDLDSWGYEIGAGPDDNFWFMEAGGAALLAKITPSGTLTEYPDPQGCTGIIAAGDGNLYCASPNGIFRVSTSSGVETLVAPQSANYLAASGTGGSAKLYYSCPGDGFVQCNSHSGIIGSGRTNYQLITLHLATGRWNADNMPPDEEFVRNVAFGADGNLWYFWYDSAIIAGIGIDVLRVLNVVPTHLTMAVGQQRTITASEAGLSQGKLTATSSNGQVATVSPGSGDTFIVTGHHAGTATIVVSDPTFNYVNVGVTVR